MLHGIRDIGDWTSKFAAPLQERFRELNLNQGEKLVVHSASYGHFGMGPFLLPWDRQKNVRWFMDEVTELVARFPNMQELHFVGHSNGTYVLANALQRYQALKVNRVVLAGCVLRRDFPWSSLGGRVGQVRHYVGGDDAVVALLPKVFEMPVFRWLGNDIGGAGFDGFTDGLVKSNETSFVRGGHAGALVDANVGSIVDFVLQGERSDSQKVFLKERPRLLVLGSSMCWALWLIGVTVVAGTVWKLPRWMRQFIDRFARGRIPTWTAHAWLCRSVFLFALWLILLTI